MLLSLFMTAAILMAGGSQPPAKDSIASSSKVRIGTYDSRSVAIAYAASKYNPVKVKMEEFGKAKAAGDKAKMKELESWGEEHQRLLHFQGFGRVPVSELLEPVKVQVQELAKKKGLSAITMSCDVVADNVEVVDVTEDLVKLYEPTERTLKMANEIRSARQLGLVELSKLPAKK
ncbi:MAG TPA: hypothetical protein PLN21_18075 [Gemmatales bacterium]|nr:hypothetical protein [Gemmatales bacterium]